MNNLILDVQTQKVEHQLATIAGILIEHFPSIIIEGNLIDLDWSKAFFAGGAIRDLFVDKTPKDYDIWFDMEERFRIDRLIKYLKQNNNVIFWSFNKKYSFALSLSSLDNININLTGDNLDIAIQIITLRFDTPERIIQTFDFYNNMHYYRFVDDKCTLYKAGPNPINLFLIPNLETSNIAILPGRLFYLMSKGYIISNNDFYQLCHVIAKTVPLSTSESAFKNKVLSIQKVEDYNLIAPPPPSPPPLSGTNNDTVPF